MFLAATASVVNGTDSTASDNPYASPGLEDGVA